MPAYLLLLAALLSRVLPHSGLYGFTAVGGSLLYFGARRNWKEMLLPVAALAAVDYYLTTHVYAYEFHGSEYVVTWGWYAAAIVLGRILLSPEVSVPARSLRRHPRTNLLLSRFELRRLAQVCTTPADVRPQPRRPLTCLAAGLPFYGRDLISTGLVLTLAFGLPVAIRQLPAQQSSARPPESAVKASFGFR
jgi:hypothetical protein